MDRPPGGASIFGVSEASVEPGYSAAHVSDLTASENDGVSIVQQQFGDEVDINTIVRRFGLTGARAMDVMGVYGDFTGILDYESAVKRIEGAQERFATLPPEVRERFGNDPGKLIDLATALSEEEFAKLMDPPKAVVDTPVATPAP